jgi:hypothetical protein
MNLDGLREIRRRGRRKLAVLAAVLTATAWLGATPASAATLTVCRSGCAYTQIGPAVAAASSGDTVSIGPGTYLGGFTIDKNLTLDGAGAQRTIISGGGSVITIGSYGATTEPTAAISGVTITGGFAQTSPESIPFFGVPGVWATGGGVDIPPTADFSGGATVTISNSVIRGNRADPTTEVDSGMPCPGFSDGECPYAAALGGGIDSWGTLTLVNSTVSDNSAGSAGTSSDAEGAGICSSAGSVTLTNTVMSGNHAVATEPNGRWAEGGAIDLACMGPGESDSLTVTNSVITSNTATVRSNLPVFYLGSGPISMGADSAGVDAGEYSFPVTIENTSVTNNVAVADDPMGEPQGFNAAISAAGPLNMTNSVVSGNQSITYAATSADVGPQGGIMGAGGGGTITNTVITHNASIMFSPAIAAVIGALEDFGLTSSLTVQNSTISGNTAKAISTSSTGVANVFGVGISNGGPIVLIGDQVNDNLGTATGPSGTAQGGGVWSSSNVYSPVPPQLTLQNTTVTRNALFGNHGITVQGGGLFTDPSESVTLTHSLIALNTPDQCYGIC